MDIEDEIVARGLLAPRITPQDIEDAVVCSQHYQFPGTTVTVVCLTLKNGFNVVGESACASLENFDPELGIRIANEDAKRAIWKLEGYLLKQRLFEGDSE